MGTRPKKDKKRLSLELSSDAYDLLSEIAVTANKNMADVLRTGISLYNIALTAKANHQTLCVAEEGKVIKEILIA